MRKAWYILLAFLLAALIGFSAAHSLVNGSKEAVTWQEETLFGDKSAVEGIRVKAINHMNQHLMWETEGTLGGELSPETKFTFSNESIQTESVMTYRGLDLYANTEFLADLAFNETTFVPEYAQKKYADLIAYCRTCYESAPIGEEKEFFLDLGEYMDYYSFAGYLDIPDATYVIDEFGIRYSNTPAQVIQELH